MRLTFERKCARLCALVLLALPGASFAQNDAEIQKDFQSFQANPARFMNQAPRIRVENNSGKALPTNGLEDQAKGNAFVDIKNRLRKESGRAGIEGNDRPESLVTEVKLFRTLEEMEKLTSAELGRDQSPWSDNYWPLYQGTLGSRSGSEAFLASADPDRKDAWKRYKNFVSSDEYSIEALLAINDPNEREAAIASLSPSEKYDLLVGDRTFTLTQKMWEQGERYFKDDKTVAKWMGICHGWAPASYLVPRPQRKIEVLASDGETKIPFYPSDIKALASLLYAEARVPSLYIGGRCNIKDPAKDPKTGRILNDNLECFDTNPGTWHMAVVNQIARVKKSFVLDATFDLEVWNQPVYGYSYKYFNPITGQASSRLRDAKVALSNVPDDKFAQYRDRRTVSLVGIAMDLTYVVETIPSLRETDSAALDARRTVRYMYDLELDANDRIIGGEWYTNLHPDFLWTPHPETAGDITSVADSYATGEWDTTDVIPTRWREAAKVASEYQQPLAKVVFALVDASRKKR